MRTVCPTSLIALLALAACGQARDAPQPPAQESEAAAKVTVQARPPVPTPARERAQIDVVSELAAYPAGLEANSADGRAILAALGPAECVQGDGTEARPFDRVCSWRSEGGTGADISLIIEQDLILGAAMGATPQGIEGWDCQRAAATADRTICMATRVSSAQSMAWAGYWNSAPPR